MSKTRANVLSPEQAHAVCRGFLILGEEVFSLMERLNEAGFRAWLPYHQFVESFAGSAEELMAHRQYIVEGAKNRLGRPWPPIRGDQTKAYFSAYIQKLCDKRDEANGVSERELSSKYPWGEAAWRREVDPCERRKVRSSIEDKVHFDAMWNIVVERQQRKIMKEVVRFATDVSRKFPFDKKGRYACFSDVMRDNSSSFGFHYDKAKSYPDYPVFSKRIADRWDLCWVIEDGKSFYWVPQDGIFAPELQFRDRELAGSADKAQPGQSFSIRYSHIVPGFSSAYWKFCSLDELELAIKAHLFLYGLMAQTIESAISSGITVTP